MSETPESGRAGRQPVGEPGTDPGGGRDGLRRWTQTLLAIYLLPAVLLVLVVGGVLMVVVKVVEVGSRAARAVRRAVAPSRDAPARPSKGRLGRFGRPRLTTAARVVSRARSAHRP
jgi:hypothetical protein